MTNGVCYPKMNINDPCENDAQCANGIQGVAECHPHNKTGKTTCVCSDNHYWNPTRDACLSIEENECMEDKQCQYMFGIESSCDSRTGQCDCQGGKFFQDYCYLPIRLNETCNISLECEAYLGFDSFCANETNVCECFPGKTCKFQDGSQMAQYTVSQSGLPAIMVGLMVLAAGIVGSIYWKKKQEYAPVHQASIIKSIEHV